MNPPLSLESPPTLPPVPTIASPSCVHAAGPPSVKLLATDNTGLLPAGWSWTATVALTGQKAYSYPVLIPASAGTAATLSSLAVSPSGGGSGEGLVNPMTTPGEVACPAILRFCGSFMLK